MQALFNTDTFSACVFSSHGPVFELSFKVSFYPSPHSGIAHPSSILSSTAPGCPSVLLHHNYSFDHCPKLSYFLSVFWIVCHITSIFLQKKKRFTYIFEKVTSREEESARKRERGVSFHILNYFPNGFNSQGWTIRSPKSLVSSFFWVSHLCVGAQVLGTSSATFPGAKTVNWIRNKAARSRTRCCGGSWNCR